MLIISLFFNIPRIPELKEHKQQTNQNKGLEGPCVKVEGTSYM